MSALGLALAGCTGDKDTAPDASPTSGKPAPTAGSQSQDLTPLLLDVADGPIPFKGSDNRTHLVYELTMTNFSNRELTAEKVEIADQSGAVIETLDTAAINGRLQPFGERTAKNVMTASTGALLFVHIVLADGATVPDELSHKVTYQVTGGPGELTVDGGDTTVAKDKKVFVGGPPLRGADYLSADSCCDATRHTRAALPINGRVWVTQRFAVDWEQIDSEGRIYTGDKLDVKNYVIYGKEVLASADATVVSVTDGQPDQTPGTFPENITPEQADGNAVVLDFGDGVYGMYAHMQAGSIKAKAGDKVKRGDVLGLVGNSGNSLAPHLHFHAMDGPLTLASNGLPYAIDVFEVTGRGTEGTEGFDKAEASGTPLPREAFSPPRKVTDALPLDQLIIDFAN